MRVTAPGGRSLISIPMVPVLNRAGTAVLDLLDLDDLLLAGALSLGLVVQRLGDGERLGMLLVQWCTCFCM